jgi:hypothetical protein
METVIELTSFIRSAHGVLTETQVQELIDYLSHNPTSGDVIPRSGGLRKLRWVRPGMGKRGGARVIYYHVAEDGEVYLLLAYAKARQENMSSAQLAQLRQWMEEQ